MARNLTRTTPLHLLRRTTHNSRRLNHLRPITNFPSTQLSHLLLFTIRGPYGGLLGGADLNGRHGY
jgi:hypothetical protein